MTCLMKLSCGEGGDGLNFESPHLMVDYYMEKNLLLSSDGELCIQ